MRTILRALTSGKYASLPVVLASAAVAIAGLVLLGYGLPTENRRAEAQTTEQRPNIVFVMTDDLDERSMQDLGGIRGVMGSNGTTFENAYVTYSLCCPSRATILRGQYPHNHQIIGNALPEGGAGKFRSEGLDKETVATWLNGAGYQTKYIGKYMNSYGGLYVPFGWDEWFAFMGDPKDKRINQDGQEIALSGHSTDVFADKTSDFITRSSANPEQPFFVMVAPTAPHAPAEIATRYQDSFAATPLPKPLNFNEDDMSDKPQYMRSFSRISPDRQSYMQDEYRKRLRSMLSVEDLLRQTITTLQQTGELNNTYIVFTSDNGYHIGNHRFGLNKKTPYEEDIGVPLMVRGPGVPPGAVRQQLVLNNDFAPTLADLAGVPTPSFVDGRSFAPLLTATPPSAWRTAFLEEGWLEGGTTVPTPTHKGVHTQEHMFVEYDTGEHELYDLSADPYQLQSKSRTGNEQLYSALETRLNSLRACAGSGCRAAEWTADTTAPTVSGVVPAGGATGVEPSANVTATFSEAIDPSTVTGTTFALTKPDGTAVAATVGYDPTTKKATLDPAQALQAGLTYTATIKGGSGGVKDLAGNALASDKAWSFTTTAAAACTISGSPSAETLTGTPADDVICAGDGNDILKGLEGNDTLKGEGGTDQLFGGAGNDTLDGGLGTDTANFSGSPAAVNASLVNNTATGEGSDVLAGVENLIGSNKADTLSGSGANNTLNGSGAADDIVGLGGADALKGAGANDTLDSRDGVGGNDSVDGGFGTDVCQTDVPERSILNCEP